MNQPGAARKGSSRSLPAGDRVEEFEILEVVGEGGFGIVYLARDHLLQREVALKEYMPASFAERGDSRTVSASASRHAEAFEAGRRSFINEARLLAQFDHPALVRVHRFWEANGTAYMVMPFYRAPTLREVIQTSGPRTEAWLRAWLVPMLEALQVLHERGIYHRDIAPDNVLMLDGERPVLLDFGAARRVIGDATQDLTVILKPGYAPIEQYAFGDGARQGPWTDLYALAAVVRYCAVGKAPPPAVSRILADDMPALATVSVHPMSEAFCAAIDRCLSVHAEGRPVDVVQMREWLSMTSVLPPPAGDDDRHALTMMPNGRAAAMQRSISAAAAQKTAGPGGSTATHGYASTAEGATESRPVTSVAAAGALAARVPTPHRRTGAVAASLGGVVALAVGGGLYFWHAAERASVSPAAGAPTVSAPNVTDAPPRRLDPSQLIKRLISGADAGWSVRLEAEQTVLKIGQDKLRFSVTSSLPGYLHILLIDADGQRIRQLFPNALDAEHRVVAGDVLKLPRAGWSLPAAGPPGVAHLLAVVAPSPREFAQIGLKSDGQGGGFDPAVAGQAWQTKGGRAFAGNPVDCQFAQATCETYGAAVVSVEELAR